MTDRRYLAAATFAGISMLLHLAVLPFGGAMAIALMGAAIWAVLALGLIRRMRSVAYVGFVIGLFGSIGALALAMAAPPGPEQWLWGGMIVADLLVALSLFPVLWSAGRP